MKFRSAAITDIGKVREKNEDRFLCNDQLGLFGVADGIGGMPGGSEAAECTVQTLLHSLPELGAQPDLVALTQATSASVRKLGLNINPPYGIGSTVTFGLLKNGRLQLAHVGDSRAYVVKNGELHALTIDHNIGNEWAKLKAQGEDIVLTSSNRKALTRCMGQPGVPEVDYQDIPMAAGERYFFATDGITNLLSDGELAPLLVGPESPQEILNVIREHVLQRGGYDNLTAVLVYIDQLA